MAQEHKTERSETRITPSNPPWRIAFPFFHERRMKTPSGEPIEGGRYDATVLAPKLHHDPAQCPNYQFLAALCIEAATKSWGGFPEGGHWPIQDGDAPPRPRAPVPGQTPQPPKEYPWRKGHWVFEVRSYLDVHPSVALVQGGQAVELPAQSVNGRQLYKSGDYGVVSMNAYTYNHRTGKFGCAFGFDGVLFVAEGEAIGSSGQRSAQQLFGSVVPFGAPLQASAPARPAHPNAPGAPVPQPPAHGMPQGAVYAPPPAGPTAASVPTAPAPAAPGYAQAPAPAAPGYAQAPAPAAPGYAQAPAAPGYAQAPAPAAPGYAQAPALPPFPQR